MNTLVVVLAVITAALGSQIPGYNDSVLQKPCQTQSQWEGRASEWDHVTESNNRFIISFDGVGLRKRVLEEKKSFMPGQRFYEYIMEYKTNTLYKINFKLSTCTTSNLTQPWQNHTIPVDAIMEDEYEMGAPGSGFMVREWSDRLPARRAESWIGLFTVDGCWPVVEVFTSDDKSTPAVSLTTRFFDLSPGIQNMSVFEPPSFCTGSESELEPDLEIDLLEPTDQPAESLLTSLWNSVKGWF